MNEQDELWILLNEFLASAFHFGAKFDGNNQEPQEAIDIVASVTSKLVTKVKQQNEQNLVPTGVLEATIQERIRQHDEQRRRTTKNPFEKVLDSSGREAEFNRGCYDGFERARKVLI